jgi:phosphotransacetylase
MPKPKDHSDYNALLKRCNGLAPIVTAVVHPTDAPSLSGAIDAARAGLITPILVGNEARIRAAARAAKIALRGYEIITAPHSHAAAEIGVSLARNGRVEAIMKGKIHTDELMHAVMSSESGLRTERRISHVFVMDVPTYPRWLMITDAAINIEPTLEDKRDICQNAIDLAHMLDIAQPKVAVLAAVETVTSKMRSTIDAAALCKMAERGQITGALLDGPLAFDNAISLEAAKTKGIVSRVAGSPDILVVPDIESGNMLAKQLSFLAGADAAGIVLGARVPLIVTSRSDNDRSRLASCAVAKLMVHARRKRTLQE